MCLCARYPLSARFNPAMLQWGDVPGPGGLYSNDIGVLGVLVLWLWVVWWGVGCCVVMFLYF